MRFLKGLLAFWLLVALVIAVLLVIRARDEDDRDGTGALAPPPLSCATLSDRARQCRERAPGRSWGLRGEGLCAGRPIPLHRRGPPPGPCHAFRRRHLTRRGRPRVRSAASVDGPHAGATLARARALLARAGLRSLCGVPAPGGRGRGEGRPAAPLAGSRRSSGLLLSGLPPRANTRGCWIPGRPAERNERSGPCALRPRGGRDCGGRRQPWRRRPVPRLPPEEQQQQRHAHRQVHVR